jgi:hypothetical protein
MKKLGLALLITGGTFIGADAQEQVSDSWPYWSISKDVQRGKFRNITFIPVAIKTGNIDWTISKGVQRINKDVSGQARSTVVMNGYPAWTISKGAARMQYRRENK